jgi:hypothetical protein
VNLVPEEGVSASTTELFIESCLYIIGYCEYRKYGSEKNAIWR